MEQIDIDHRLLDKFAFALLDPLRGDEASRSAWGVFPLYELAPAGFAAQAAQLPKLVDLRNLQADARKYLMHLLLNQSPPCGAELCVALLQTSADRPRVAMHFRKMVAPRFAQGQRGLFRFHDPEVLEHLVWMLSGHALAGLFGPVTTWVIPLRGEWFRQERESKLARLAPGFHLDATTWLRVQRIGAIHAALHSEPLWRTNPAEWGPRAEALLVRAEQHHLTDRDDAIAFTCHGLRWHAQIDKHPRVAALLKDCMDHPSRYRRLAGKWTDDDWRHLVAEIDKPTTDPRSGNSIKRTTQGACR